MNIINKVTTYLRKICFTEFDLVLRTCNANMKAYGGFKWPETGTVSAPDWDPKPECGNGLHGLLHGCGYTNYLSKEPDAKWLVVAVPKGTCVDIDRRSSFRHAKLCMQAPKKKQSEGSLKPILGTCRFCSKNDWKGRSVYLWLLWHVYLW